MAEKKVCVQHPCLPKQFCYKFEDTKSEKPKVDAKEAKKVEAAETDACMKNEECRMMHMKLKMLTHIKTGYPSY
ncbi:MAG TPA: hypothetical protein PLZ86_03995 [bacterium]|nr:hypothetical protein [bacterium]